MDALGRHILAELYDCDPTVLNDEVRIAESLNQAARQVGATIISSSFHHFNPIGVSGVVVIQESHLAIHTWPEYGYAAIDLFTCGNQIDPWGCYEYLKTILKASHGSTTELHRGQKAQLQRQALAESRGAAQAPGQQQHEVWFTEVSGNVANSYKHTGTLLYRKQSPYQRVEVYDTMAYGRALMLDGILNTTEKDEFSYHEMMAHVPALVHPAPRRALVIGGGDGGVVRELMRHPEVEQVELVEIDALVIEAARQFLPSISSAFNDPRLTVRIEDGIHFVKNAPSEVYDMVLVDSTDPEGTGEVLFTEAFYRHVHRILAPQGIMVTQSNSPAYDVAEYQRIYGLYYQIFGTPNVHSYLFNVPTYPTGLWSFSFAVKGGGLHPVESVQRQRQQQLMQQGSIKYYNPAIHQAAFALPTFANELLLQAQKQAQAQN